MKNFVNRYSIAYLLSFILFSCGEDPVAISNDGILDSNEKDIVASDGTIKSMSATIQDFSRNDSVTRMSYNIYDNGVKTIWDITDTLGVVPSVGSQAAFPVQNAEVSSNYTHFNGGGWGLKDNCTYTAYYPLINTLFLDPNAVPITYKGQTQDGNDPMKHLAHYDFLAASETTASEGSLNFKFSHIGALVAIKLTMPRTRVYRQLVISSDKPIVESGTVNLNNHSFSAKESNDTFIVFLKNTKNESEGEEIIVYMLLAPQDLSESVINLELYSTDNSIFEGSVMGQNFESGRFYCFASVLEEGNKVDQKVGVSEEEDPMGEENVNVGL